MTRMEVRSGAPAAGGGCVARAADGRVVFVRHALPGELIVAEVTEENASFLRADAVEILSPSVDRVVPPCPVAGPGRCGGCDWQHASLPAQRRMKAELVSEQMRRLAGDDRPVVVEEAPREAGGLGWRTRIRFAVDGEGRTGFHRHRSHQIEPVAECPIASPAVSAAGVGHERWRGARTVEVATTPTGGRAVVSVETGRDRLVDRPHLRSGRVVNGRVERGPHQLNPVVLGHRYRVSSGVFWQVHRDAPAVLARAVLDGLRPAVGERVADLYAGAGLFSVVLADAVGPDGSVVAVERNAAACGDLRSSTRGCSQVTVCRAEVDAGLVTSHLGTPDLVVLDPARQGAGRPVMEALASLDPPPRMIAYVSCDAATFARDVRVVTDRGWTMTSLRAFDLFPMTEHVELLGLLVPPG